MSWRVLQYWVHSVVAVSTFAKHRERVGGLILVLGHRVCRVCTLPPHLHGFSPVLLPSHLCWESPAQRLSVLFSSRLVLSSLVRGALRRQRRRKRSSAAQTLCPLPHRRPQEKVRLQLRHTGQKWCLTRVRNARPSPSFASFFCLFCDLSSSFSCGFLSSYLSCASDRATATRKFFTSQRFSNIREQKGNCCWIHVVTQFKTSLSSFLIYHYGKAVDCTF